MNWQLLSAAGGHRLRASHPVSLARMSWLLPALRYRQPGVLAGQAEVVRDGDFWRVTAADVPLIELALEPALDALPGGAAAALAPRTDSALRTLQ